MRPVGRDDLGSKGVVHRLAVGGDVARAIVQDASLGIVDQHVVHVGRAQRAAGQIPDRIQIEEIQRIGQRVGQLPDLRLAGCAHLLGQQAVGALAGDIDDLALAALLALPEQHHHQHHDPQHHQDPDLEPQLQVEPGTLHSTSDRKRCMPVAS